MLISVVAVLDMSSRTILSRPRTRIYDVNYDMGQNYYKTAIDNLDRKYSPRPLSPIRSSVAKDIFDRHLEAFAEEDLQTSRRRAEKSITKNNLFDFRGGQIAQRALDMMENDTNQEPSSTLNRLRASKRISSISDETFEDTVNNINSQRFLERSEKALRSVGLNESRKAVGEDVSIKQKSLKVTYEGDNDKLVKWSPLQRLDENESAAARRAKQSRDRLLDLEEEMTALAEKQAARERRTARLKALVAESTEQTEAAQSAIKAVNFRSRREQINFEE